MKKLLVVDGNSILNRAFYGVRPLTTRDGRNTNAIFGFINNSYMAVSVTFKYNNIASYRCIISFLYLSF